MASIISEILVNVFYKIKPFILSLYNSCVAKFIETAPPKLLPRT